MGSDNGSTSLELEARVCIQGSTREDKRVATSESDSANSEGGIEDVLDTELVQNKSLRRSDRSSVSDSKLEAPEEALQSPRQAPLSPDYVPGLENPPSPNYTPSPEEPKQAPLTPVYVPETEYPEYLLPSDAEAPTED
ncbi:hypothetical protein Tco_0674230 [Tanacetum coccineum]